ncbi:MAG: hypothetical protein E4H40_04130 [Candidatus Brocadiia bacterium]|nr:MAG: hypothetical protein E4H40_04130 [Candidatus Brocadiia bacterium]
MFNLTEQPWTIAGIAVFSAIVIWIIQAVTPQKKKSWLWLIPFVIAGTGFAIDHFIQTDKEKITTTVYQSVKAVENENTDKLGLLIALTYSDSFHSSRQALIGNFRSRMSEPLIKKAVPGIVEIVINPQAGTAAVQLNVRVIFEEQSLVAKAYKQMFETLFDLTLVKQSENWLIDRVELVKLDFQPTKWNSVQTLDW